MAPRTPPAGLPRALRLCLGALWLTLLPACRTQDLAPELLGIVDVGPRAVGLGDSIDVAVTNLPPRKTARVTITGALHRPGHEPEEGLDLDVQGVVNGPRVEVPVDEQLMQRLCGAPDVAEHTTFRGAIRVSFTAATPGALPITGSIGDVAIDLRPPPDRKARREARLTEAERSLGTIGLRVADEPRAGGGLVVTDVAQGSAADQAGLRAGDAVVGLEGWNVFEKADLLPSGRGRSAVFSVVRAGESSPTAIDVELRGYKPGAASDLLWVGLLLGTAASAILFLASPLARALGWLDRFAARATLAHAGRRNVVTWLLGSLLAFWRNDASHGGGDALPYVVFLAASGLCSLLPFGRQVTGLEPDAVTLVASSTLLSCAVAIAQGERPGRGGWSPIAGLRLGAWTALYHLPTAISVGCAMLMVGSFHLADVVRAQGGAPWHWQALRTPAGLPMLLLFFAPVLLDRSPPASKIPDAEPAALSNLTTRARQGGIARPLAWGSTFVLCGLAAALFLGGWSLPFVERSAHDRHFALQALGALLFLLKTWALALGVAVARETLPRVRVDQTGSPWAALAMPLSIATAALTAGWLAWDPSTVVRRATAGVVTLLTAALCVHVARRLAQGVRAAGAQPHVSPFL